jgi:hypothetical protein
MKNFNEKIFTSKREAFILEFFFFFFFFFFLKESSR